VSIKITFVSLTHRYDDTRILHKEARALAEAGNEVTHLTPATGDEVPTKVGCVHIVTYGTGDRGKWHRAVALWKRLSQEAPDICHCNEVESWILGCLYKSRNPQTQVVFDVHEHYPSRFEESRFPRWARLIGPSTIRLLFRLLAPYTDHIILAKRSVAPDFRVTPGKTSYIFNYAPRRMQPPALSDVPATIRALFARAKTAVHIGSLSRERGWPQLLDALGQTQIPWHVVQLGEIVEGRETIMERAGALGVADRLHIIDRVPYADLFQYLVCAQVGLMLYQPDILNHVYAFPMKLYDYLLAGIPVIGPDFAPEVTPVVEGAGCGWLIDTADSAALTKALDEAADTDEATIRGQRGRHAAETQYTWEQQAERLVAIYHDLIERAGS